jgi:hypothetical protein
MSPITTDKILDVIFFVMGPVIFILGFFAAFQPHLNTPEGRVAVNAGQHFYPTTGEIILMAIGAGLVCFGFLRRHWTKLDKSKEADPKNPGA